MLRPEKFDEGMRGLAEADEPRSVPVERILARARRRYRTRQAVLPAAAAACVVAVAATVALVSGAATGRDAQPAVTSRDSAPDPRVPQDGDTVRAVGSVLLRGDGAPSRLCADQAVIPQPPPWAECPGVDVVGPSLAVRADGRAGVIGTWRSGTIEAQEQFAPPPAPVPAPQPEIPCSAPPGGRPTSRLNYDDSDAAAENWKRYLQDHPERNDRTLQIVDAGGGSVLVFLAADETERVRVAEELGALVGLEYVCAIVSNVDPDGTRRLLDEISGLDTDGNSRPADETGPRIGLDGVFSAGLVYSPDLTEQSLTIKSVTVTPELAFFEAEHQGRVVLSPMVQVVGDGAEPGPTAVLAPTPSTISPTPQGAPAQRDYQVSMRTADVYTDERWAAIRNCFDAAGVAVVGLQGDSLPPVQGVQVTGSAAVEDFERCILGVEGARLTHTADGARRAVFATGSRNDIEVSGYSPKDPSLLGLSLESCHARAQVAALTETPDEVRVRVVGDRQDPASGNLCQDLLTVPLTSPLGGRVVVDEASGDEVQPD